MRQDDRAAGAAREAERPAADDPLARALAGMGLESLHGVFAANDIDAAMLDRLTESDLRELGLTLGQRKRFLQAREQAAAPAAPERRQMTALFCDLVGSTRLATELDPEELRELMERYHRTVAAALRRHGGHLAYTQGDGAMAYFGYPAAREDDPECAIRAGLDAAREVAALTAPSGRPLEARVAIATGVVVVGAFSDGEGGSGGDARDMVVGETPNLAARLQEVARPGDVVVSDMTRRLAGGLFDYEGVGALKLKGFPDPVEVFRVAGESRHESRFEAKARGGLSPIVGRDSEIARIRALWAEAREGAGRAAFLCGDAGIGKSRLLRALADGARAEGGRLVRWYCQSHLTNRPLHPVMREIERSLGLARTGEAAARRERLAAEVAANPALDEAADLPLLLDLFGLAERPVEGDAARRARLTLDLLARRVEGLSREGPLLLAFEDAHWADPPSQDFLGTLEARLAALPALLVVTHRSDFAPPWRGETIRLDRIGREAGEALARSVAGDRPLPAPIMRRILERADGVPLFVEELTKIVVEATPEADGGASAESVAIPATLKDSLTARLDRLGGAKETAQLGAAIGRDFTAEMLRAVDPRPRKAELAALCAAGLLFESPQPNGVSYVFHHALVQDAAYDSLLKRRRREIHRAIAGAMLGGDPAFAGAEPEVVARHCALAGLSGPAVEHWIAAGMQALDRAANVAAVAHLRAALSELEALPEDEARARTELRLQMALAPALMATRGWGAAEVKAACLRSRELALALEATEELFGAAWGLWTHYFLRGEMDDALDAARAVETMAGEAGDPMLRLAAAHAIAYSHYSRGELAEGLAAVEAGLPLFDMERERRLVRRFQLSSAAALHAIAACLLWQLGRAEEAYEMRRRGIELSERLGHAPTLAQVLSVSSFAVMFDENWALLGETAERVRRLSEEEGFQFWELMARMHLALVRAARGDAQGPAECREIIAALRGIGAPLTLSQHEAVAARFLIGFGRPAAALEGLDLAREDAGRRREGVHMPELLRVRAAARRALGDAEGAAADLAEALALARRQGAAPLIGRIERDSDETAGAEAVSATDGRRISARGGAG